MVWCCISRFNECCTRDSPLPSIYICYYVTVYCVCVLCGVAHSCVVDIICRHFTTHSHYLLVRSSVRSIGRTHKKTHTLYTHLYHYTIILYMHTSRAAAITHCYCSGLALHFTHSTSLCSRVRCGIISCVYVKIFTINY